LRKSYKDFWEYLVYFSRLELSALNFSLRRVSHLKVLLLLAEVDTNEQSLAHTLSPIYDRRILLGNTKVQPNLQISKTYAVLARVGNLRSPNQDSICIIRAGKMPTPQDIEKILT
jgi:hypothetical protein